MEFPNEFKEFHERLLGDELEDFLDFFNHPPNRTSIRVNTLKTDMRSVKRYLGDVGVEYGRVEWCDLGLWVSEKSLDTLEHQLGMYYIQSASSMIAPTALGAANSVADLCAAPGGKTTHLAQLMDNKGLLVANEKIPSRIKALTYNLQRMGVTNCLVTKNDAVRYNQIGSKFDKILLDAPCSGVGTLTQSREILSRWSIDWVNRLAKLQKKMILTAYDCLKPGGSMVYTTCTTSVQENEEVVNHLLGERSNSELEKIDLKGLKPVYGLLPGTEKSLRIYPHLNGCDPHFVAKVKKG